MKLTRLGLASLVLALGAANSSAQVKAMDLTEMVTVCDHAVYGQIVSKQVRRIDASEKTQGRDLYYTTLTIAGRSLEDGTAVQVDVSYPGGFVSEEEGYWHSESPGDDETKIGSHIVAFYKWMPAMGGAHTTNWLYANHGGIYQSVQGPKGALVLGRGPGYAVKKNLQVTDLEKSVQRIRLEDAQRKSK